MNPKRFALVAAALILMIFPLPAAAHPQFVSTVSTPPANDTFAGAMAVPGLPFGDTVNIAEATTELDEQHFCAYSPRTVWYSFTPGANVVVRADTAGSGFSDTNLTVYQAFASEIGSLSFMTCTSYGGSVTFNAQVGATYYLQAGSIYSSIGALKVNLQEVPPPPNDDLANATPIGALPFDESVDATAASMQADEPQPSCGFGSVSRSIWYAYTPVESGSISASVYNAPFSTVIAAYTGASLGNLTQVGCREWGGLLTFRAEAGVTYYFQVGGLFGQGGPLQFRLEVTPPPIASFYFYPYDPSAYDTVQFCDSSYDPGGMDIQSRSWDFGDGATATDYCATHRYAADRDYMVQLTVTTVDGRTASISQPVQVRTHDVAITKVSAPQSARAGQTRQIVVGVKNARYPENVQVQLYKSAPGSYGGFELVGTLTQFVPVRSANRTTDFNFSYTFTSGDASIGKVTFKAVAIIVDARDALQADNEAIASPTKVAP